MELGFNENADNTTHEKEILLEATSGYELTTSNFSKEVNHCNVPMKKICNVPTTVLNPREETILKPYRLGIIGVGFVGNAILKSFQKKKMLVVAYDKFKSFDALEDTIDTDILFLCLPTLFDEDKMQYDKSAIVDICEYLVLKKYNGVVVIKSTVEPNTTDMLDKSFPSLSFLHNPEFLTAKTAEYDFHHQTHVVLGCPSTLSMEKLDKVKGFYEEYYPEATLSVCSSTESEMMKISCNSFYSVKVQFFTELYMLCKKIGCNYEKVKNLMMGNQWINPMHTKIPGPDGNISYGGYCFPKDTNAFLEFFKKNDSPHAVLNATIKERNEMRPHRFF